MRSIEQRNAIVAAALAVLGGVALAQPVDGVQQRGELSFVAAQSAQTDSARSAADVRAETVAAVTAGAIAHGEASLAQPVSASRETRAEVNAQTRLAMQQQLIARGEAPAPVANGHESARVRLAAVR